MIQALLVHPLQWNLPLLFVSISLIALYLLSRKQFTKRSVRIQSMFFIAGIILFYFIIGSPFASFTSVSFSLHMIQMSVLYFMIPPLLLLGIPSSFYFPTHFLFHFTVSKWALALFSILLFFYHLPFVLTFLSENEVFRYMYLSFLFLFAVSMWMPIASIHPAIRVTKRSLQTYVFYSGLLITPACLLFIVSAFLGEINNPLLSSVTAHLCLPPSVNATTLFAPIPPQIDQFTAGVCMLALHKVSLLCTLRIQKRLHDGI